MPLPNQQPTPATTAPSADRRTVKAAWIVGIFAGGVFAVVTATYVFKLATGTTYTPDQWAAAGGWISGIATVAAVGVALRQSHQVRKDAIEARADAEKLLATELDTGRRTDQINAILAIWPHLAEINRWNHDEFAPAMNRLRQAREGGTEPCVIREEANALRQRWKTLEALADNAFARALLVVVQPDIARALELTYKTFMTLGNEVRLSTTAIATQSVDHSLKTHAAINNMLQDRRNIIALARKFLTQAEPINFLRTDDTT